MQDIFHQEIYVQAVPPGGAKYQISAAGGEAPMWRREGKELFYISADRKLTAVPITLGSTVVAGSPQPLFTFPSRADKKQAECQAFGRANRLKIRPGHS